MLFSIGMEKGLLGFTQGEFTAENNGTEYRLILHADMKHLIEMEIYIVFFMSTGTNYYAKVVTFVLLQATNGCALAMAKGYGVSSLAT